MKRFIICLIAFTQLSHGEDITLLVENQTNQFGFSQTITLNQGDSARLIFISSFHSTLSLVCTIESKTFVLPAAAPIAPTTGLNPIAIAGPATVGLKCGGIGTTGMGAVIAQSYFATFSITRSGITSPPAEIPQEAGTTWDVILESSSDLVNWTPANPGEYTGTEPKRFFRTRMVKKP
jgi:hypothetical protein